jgi:hypothetical protein
MPLRFIFRGSLLLIVALAAAITLVRAQPHERPPDLRAFLSPPDGCTAPCWQGIRPGVTTVNDAYDILEQLEWVESVDLYIDLNSLVWTWNGTQPDWIDASQRGVVVMDGKHVQYVGFSTNLSFGDVWLALGAPEQNVVRLAGINARVVEHVAFYLDGNVRVLRTPMSCHVSVADYWSDTVDILVYRSGNLALDRSRDGSTFDPYDRPYC